MAKASDLKKGMVVEINGAPHVVKQVEVRSPSSRGASIKVNTETGKYMARA